MLTIKCLGAGSSGNCWVLDYNGQMLLLDAGLPVKVIKKGVDFNLIGIRGVCITHIHNDHALAVKELRQMGLQIFCPYETENPPKKVNMAPFTVQPFTLPHGDVTCYGFYIKVDDRRILYMTDFELCTFNFSKIGITDMIVECNYQDSYLNKNAENVVHKVLGHAELQTTIGFVRNNLTDSLENVILTHLGVGTCDGNECVDEIKKIVKSNVNVDYARADETYILKRG